MAGFTCDRTGEVLGLVCFLLALPLAVFTNKAAWGALIGEPEERRNAEACRMEAVVPSAPARPADDAGCDRRSLFSWLCLIPVGGLLAPGFYFLFFC